jgi:MFS family permease
MRETTMQTYLMDNSPPQLRATVFGIYFGFGQQGSSIIQPVAGDLMDIMGIARVFNLMALISIGLSVLAVVFAFRTAGRNPRKAI